MQSTSTWLPLAFGRRLRADPGTRLFLLTWPQASAPGDSRVKLVFDQPNARSFREKALLAATISCGRTRYLQRSCRPSPRWRAFRHSSSRRRLRARRFRFRASPARSARKPLRGERSPAAGGRRGKAAEERDRPVATVSAPTGGGVVPRLGSVDGRRHRRGRPLDLGAKRSGCVCSRFDRGCRSLASLLGCERDQGDASLSPAFRCEAAASGRPGDLRCLRRAGQPRHGGLGRRRRLLALRRLGRISVPERFLAADPRRTSRRPFDARDCQVGQRHRREAPCPSPRRDELHRKRRTHPELALERLAARCRSLAGDLTGTDRRAPREAPRGGSQVLAGFGFARGASGGGSA
jgi:hypothetical protein